MEYHLRNSQEEHGNKDYLHQETNKFQKTVQNSQIHQNEWYASKKQSTVLQVENRKMKKQQDEMKRKVGERRLIARL